MVGIVRLMNTPHTTLSRRARGFTLVEMLIVVCIMGILSGVAFPYLGTLVDSIRMRSIANEFLSSMILARSEAIKRNGRVALCKSADGSACANTGHWEQGWIVFHDADNDGIADAGEQLIQRVQALPAGFRLSGNPPVSRYISFSPIGKTRTVGGAFQAGTVTLCKSAGRSSEGREIVLNKVGRMRVNKIAVAECTEQAAQRRTSSTTRLELVHVLEAAVDAGKAHVGHLVQLLELAHHELAELGRCDLAQPGCSSFSSMRSQRMSICSMLTGRLRSASDHRGAAACRARSRRGCRPS